MGAAPNPHSWRSSTIAVACLLCMEVHSTLNLMDRMGNQLVCYLRSSLLDINAWNGVVCPWWWPVCWLTTRCLHPYLFLKHYFMTKRWCYCSYTSKHHTRLLSLPGRIIAAPPKCSGKTTKFPNSHLVLLSVTVAPVTIFFAYFIQYMCSLHSWWLLSGLQAQGMG